MKKNHVFALQTNHIFVLYIMMPIVGIDLTLH